MLTIRIILAPDSGTVNLLSRRTGPDGKVRLQEKRPGAIGLFEARLPDLYYYADCAFKASNVAAIEISGNCPQHVSTIALLGDVEAVRHSLGVIRQLEAEGGKDEI